MDSLSEPDRTSAIRKIPVLCVRERAIVATSFHTPGTHLASGHLVVIVDKQSWCFRFVSAWKLTAPEFDLEVGRSIAERSFELEKQSPPEQAARAHAALRRRVLTDAQLLPRSRDPL